VVRPEGGDHRGAPSYFTTGRYYNAQTKSVVGTYNCPTGGDGGT
jgi:hypothetical protein